MRDEKIMTINMKSAYNELYKYERSETLHNIWHQVYGEDYPKELNPDSPVTITDLRKIAQYLKIEAKETFIDVGCGRGGPGMWVAREIGASYYGFDLSETGIKVASERAIEFGLKGRAEFGSGDICESNFPNNHFDAAVSIGAIAFIPNKQKAIHEIARIIRLNALFIFITVEEKKPHLVNDYRPLLSKAGFKVNLYEETSDYNRRQGEVYKKIIENKKQLIKEMGYQAAAPWIMEAKMYLPRLKIFRRVFVVSNKQNSS
jgi:ubiquinone/menaquinone biosynthesis C-methylase UbiE